MQRHPSEYQRLPVWPYFQSCSLVQIGQTRELAHLEWNRAAETIRTEVSACVHSKIVWAPEVVKYREAIGELIYTLIVCRVDISMAVITLSQYAFRPAQIHYEAVKQVFCI